jgi:methylthioribose-1-phosphate isomerase
MQFKTVDYNTDTQKLVVLDQTRLPEEKVYVDLNSIEDVYHAITCMQVRGAPLIGVVAAYGVVLAAVRGDRDAIINAADYIKSARPTAVNLAWAIERMKQRLGTAQDLYNDLLDEAQKIASEDQKACERIGSVGADLIHDNMRIMVHCNAGALATCGIGTALGVLYTAHMQGKKMSVYSCETRPLLQGARLTSWELTTHSIETYTICDDMAATYMPDMHLVLVGADRIARNGDTANKIGTRGLAIIADYYRVPFYVAAPTSTFDVRTASGADIPIEVRCDDEVRMFNQKKIVAEKAKICNPAFDVTPAALITGIITEKGIIRPPYEENIIKLIGDVK